MTLRTILAAGTILLGFHGGPVAAAEVTPEQRSALEALVKSWYSVGGHVFAAGSDAARVVAAGDHFDVTAPLRLSGSVRGEMRVEAKALPREENRWRFENVRIGTPITLTADVPVPPKEGQKQGATRTEPLTYTVKVAEQDGSADYDPTFRTPTRSVSTLKGMVIDVQGSGIAQQSVVDAGTSEIAITPAGPDAARVDAQAKSELSGYRMTTHSPGGGADDVAVGFEARRMALVTNAHEVSKEQFGKLMAALSAVGEQVKTTGGAKPAPLPPALREQLAGALRGLASDLSFTQDLEQFKLTVAGMVFAFDKGRAGFGGDSKDGLARATVEFGYDGLAMPDMGMGFEELVPRRLALKPYVSGMAADGVSQVLATAMSGKDPVPRDFAPLFSKGPVVAGIESMAIDVAGTVFTGEGRFTMTSPQLGTGTARVVADNLDGLIQKLNEQPMAQQAVPAIVFLKGIGRNENGKLVWEVNYAPGGKLTVNGLDMSAMTGGAPKGAAPRR